MRFSTNYYSVNLKIFGKKKKDQSSEKPQTSPDMEQSKWATLSIFIH